ncbi:MAG: hypothetical protein KatS3mg036_0933 [Ignavibacterium sp.]|nr:MAG: hypothetical protein KatS3mg036_0933 [Ignavibacterium sp.]
MFQMKGLKEIKAALEDSKTNPRDLKRELARTLVSMYYDEEAATKAQEEFDKIFIKKEIPDEIDEFHIEENTEINILDLLLLVNFAPSKGEAKRLVQQGGVSIDGEKVSDVHQSIKIKSGMILKVGKRKFLKLIEKGK